MATLELLELLDRVRHEVARCPRELMEQQLRDVIRDFCQFTRAYVHTVPDDTIQAAVSDYDISLPNSHVEPVCVEYMTVDGAPCHFREIAWLDRYITNWRKREADDFRFFTHLSPGQYTFPCIPTKDGTQGGVFYRVALRPTKDATEIDEHQVNEWIEVWSDGTKSRLMSMEGEPWHKPKRAKELDARYMAGRREARIRVDRSYGNAEQRWVGPRFA